MTENIAETMNKKRKKAKRDRQIIIATAILLLAIIIGISVALLLRNKDDNNYLTISIIQDGSVTTRTITYDNGAKLSEIVNPTAPAGYLFRGWFESDTSTEILPTTTSINSSTTLYARFAKEATAGISYMFVEEGDDFYYIVGEGDWESASGFNNERDEAMTDIVIADMIYNEDLDKFLPVKIITLCAFNSSNITSLYMHDFVTTIEEYAFYYCLSLEVITFSKGLKYIGNDAFVECRSLYEITLPAGLEMIKDGAFARSGLRSIVFPDELETIWDRVFVQCLNLTTLTLPKGLTIIGESAFEYCTALESIILPENLKTIKLYAFQGCSSLETVILPEGIKTIQDSAFKDCINLTSIIIPEGLDYIGEGYGDAPSFSGCTNLIIYLNITEDEASLKFSLSWYQGTKAVKYVGEWYIDESGMPQEYSND